MIKNLSKIMLGVFVLCTGFFALNATYATCTADVGQPGFVCFDTESCDLVGGCLCDGNGITNGASCAFPVIGGGIGGGADGIFSPIAYQALCTDVDGCTCIGGNPLISFAQGQQCLSDNVFTVQTSNGLCTDVDGCICDGMPLLYNGSCSAFTVTPPSGGGGGGGGGGGSTADTTAPLLTAGAVANTGTAFPTFTFTSNEAGTLSYSGVCASSTTAATGTTQTITFGPLATGTYLSGVCKVRVTDSSANASLWLIVPTFTLTYTGAIPTTPPTGATSGGGGGGGSSQAKDNCTSPGSLLPGANLSGIDYSPSYYDEKCGQQAIPNSNYSVELKNAYLRAYAYGITTMDSINKADMGGKLLRSHLAKMMSNFAINLGGHTPNTSLACDFVDIADQSTELQGYIRLACQLGIMGINTDGTVSSKFNPDDTVDRAQFGTILSRVVWGSVYNGGNPRYDLHLNALKSANIMTLISQPYKSEIRGYVMIMMRRTYEEGFLND